MFKSWNYYAPKGTHRLFLLKPFVLIHQIYFHVRIGKAKYVLGGSEMSYSTVLSIIAHSQFTCAQLLTIFLRFLHSITCKVNII